MTQILQFLDKGARIMVRVPFSSKAPKALYIYQKLKKICNNSYKLTVFIDLDSELPDQV